MREFIELMRELNHQDGTTFIFSTHDQRVMAHADRIVRVVDGLIADDGLSSAKPHAAQG